MEWEIQLQDGSFCIDVCIQHFPNSNKERGMNCVSKEYEIKTKMVYTWAMTTAKNAIFIELQLENCYLVRGV